MQKEGFVAQTAGDMTVVLDANLTPELIEEGYVRELISKIRTMRKDAGFDVTDRIDVTVNGSAKINAIVEKAAGDIMSGVLALSVNVADPAQDAYSGDKDINDEKCLIGIRVVSR